MTNLLTFYILGEENLYLKGAIAETRDIKKRQHKENPNVKEWDKDYPSPVLVRQKYRPADKPFLIIYPLNPEKSKHISGWNTQGRCRAVQSK